MSGPCCFKLGPRWDQAAPLRRPRNNSPPPKKRSNTKKRRKNVSWGNIKRNITEGYTRTICINWPCVRCTRIRGSSHLSWRMRKYIGNIGTAPKHPVRCIAPRTVKEEKETQMQCMCAFLCWCLSHPQAHIIRLQMGDPWRRPAQTHS